MQAEQIDETPLVREKQSASDQPDPLMPGHSGDNIGDTTTSKLSVAQYNEQIRIEPFKVTDQPDFLLNENEDEDIDNVQRKYRHKS